MTTEDDCRHDWKEKNEECEREDGLNFHLRTRACRKCLKCEILGGVVLVPEKGIFGLLPDGSPDMSQLIIAMGTG